MSIRPIATLVCLSAVIAGCGSTTSTPATHSTPIAKVSVACETVREQLAEEEKPNAPGHGRYLAEDKEMVKQECGAAGQAREAEIQHEQTPQGAEEKAKQTAKESAQLEKEVKEGKRPEVEGIAREAGGG